jgi:hypothetical protein
LPRSPIRRRRAILARPPRAGEALRSNELAEPFDMSQPAISKHLKVLERAGTDLARQDAQRRPRKLEPSRSPSERRGSRTTAALGARVRAPRRRARGAQGGKEGKHKVTRTEEKKMMTDNITVTITTPSDREPWSRASSMHRPPSSSMRDQAGSDQALVRPAGLDRRHARAIRALADRGASRSRSGGKQMCEVRRLNEIDPPRRFVRTEAVGRLGHGEASSPVELWSGTARRP